MPRVLQWFWLLVPANALATRIVCGASRRKSHLFIRSGYLLGLTLLMVTMLLASGGLTGTGNLSDMAKNAAWVFVVVAHVQVAFICLLAPLFMAGAIQQEQSGETLDILLSTPLSNLQIVLGSLLGRMFFVLVLLASGLPLFSVLLLFGGVAAQAVFAAFAIAALTAIGVGSVAVMLAVTRAGGRRAVMIFIVTIAGYLLLGFAADGVIQWSRSRAIPVAVASNASTAGVANIASPPTAAAAPPVAPSAAASPAEPAWMGGSSREGMTTWLTPLHPLLVLRSVIYSANYRPPTPAEVAHLHPVAAFYLSRPLSTFALLTLGLSFTMLFFAATQLRRINQGEAVLLPALMSLLSLGMARRARRARTVTRNPIAWRESHNQSGLLAGRLLRVGFPLLSLCATLTLIWSYHDQLLPHLRNAEGRPLQQAEVFLAALGVLLQIQTIVILLVTLYISGGSISREREDGTLDLLLTTPLTPSQFIWGKLRGLLSYVGSMAIAPVLTLAMVLGYTWLASAQDWPTASYTSDVLVQDLYSSGQNMAIERPLVTFEGMLFFPLALFAFVGMSAAVGMNWSVKAKGVFHAVAPSIAVIALVMTVTGFCGYASAERIPIVGIFLNAFSPFTMILTVLDPYTRAAGYITDTGSVSVIARILLITGPLAAAIGYSVVIYVGIDSLIRNFDMTVRKSDNETNPT